MSDLDRLKAAVAGALRALVRRVDYTALYEAEVVSQHADGSLDLRPLTDRLPPMTKVRIRYGAPGVVAKIRSGGTAVVGFHGADPAKPYAMIVDAASIESLSLFGGTRPLARIGDSVKVPFPPAQFIGTMVTPVGPAPLAGPIIISQFAPGIILTGQRQALG